MNGCDTGKRTIGVTISETGTDIRVWAPAARTVTLHHERGGADIALRQEDYGYWVATSIALKAGDRYTLSLDDGPRLPDPASLAQPDGVHGASMVADPAAFTWSDHNWQAPDPATWVIYELHVGTFSEEGTFAGLERRLDHLLQLGVNAIELMPVAQFPGSRNWGYDGVFPFAVQHSYGGVAGLQRLVNTCHERGMAVILDVVYNHLGPEGNYLEAYGPYFTGKYKTPWGKAVNFDDAWCDPVRRYFLENALMWLRDFHVDALRLDAVHAIRDYSPVHIVRELNDAVAGLNRESATRKFLIAETDQNDSRIVKPVEAGGYGLRAQWNDEFHHALRVAAGQERYGYYADFDGLPDLAKAFRDAYVYTGQYSRERKRFFGTGTEGITGDHFVVFAQNHDQIGNRMKGDRLSMICNRELQKLIAAVVLTAPFIPLLFMGEEWAAATPFPYFISHSDKALIEAVEKGRREEFAGFAAQGEPFPAQDEATFLAAKLDWNELQQERHSNMFAYYKELIALRRRHAPFTNYDRSAVEVLCDEEHGVLIVERSFKEQHCYCLFNFSDQERSVQMDKYMLPLQVAFCSSEEKWMGPQDCGLVYDRHRAQCSLAPVSATILVSQYVQP